MWKASNKYNPGFSLLEIITTVAVMAVLFTGGVSIFRLSHNAVDLAKDYTLAELKASDLIELTISKRNEDWNSLIPGVYHFIEDPLNPGAIIFNAGTEVDSYFTKWVEILAVERDGSGAIVASGGTVDLDTMKAVSHVTWSERGKNYEVELVQYLTNWRRF